MNRIMRVAELIEKYFPADNILHRVPNYKFSDHYILHDNFMGLITTKNVNQYKNDYDHIDNYNREDVLAMSVDPSMFNTHKEQDIAKYIKDLLNSLPQYIHHDIHH